MFEGQILEFTKSGNLVVVRRKLASGCFGDVFQVMDRDGLVLAVKECRVDSERELRQIESEINTLSSLRGLGSNTPTYVDHFVGAIENGSFECLILMSLEPGIPVQASISSHAECKMQLALNMLTQLLPTLKLLDTVCCHRDLNNHNILFDEPSGKFSVVDFGLAVEKNDWWHYKWRDSSVGGDPRYWPACSWRMLLDGWARMTPLGTEQYKEKLDMHSFAISLLEVICSGSCPVPLKSAWDTYWADATRFASLFHSCFMSKGDWSMTKQDLSKLDVIRNTAKNLKQLKRALRTLRSSHFLFTIIERMLCVNEMSATASWSYISNAIEEGCTKFSTDAAVHALRVNY